MTIEEMKRQKKELGYSNKTISEKSGVPLGTVQKIFAGITESPREETINALSEVFPKKPELTEGRHYSDFVREDAAAYGTGKLIIDIPYNPNRRGPYTIRDYMALPDERRVELIDGYFFEMFAPTFRHQAIADWLCRKLIEFILQNKGSCYAFTAPLDVQLDKDEFTMVQPDVLVVCDRTQYEKFHGIYGAPELAIEVLSPSTRKKDMQIKLSKYANAGVREYWLVDPDKQLLLQYDLENAEMPRVYNFSEEVPVLIWDKKCRIDLQEMADAIAFLPSGPE